MKSLMSLIGHLGYLRRQANSITSITLNHLLERIVNPKMSQEPEQNPPHGYCGILKQVRGPPTGSSPELAGRDQTPNVTEEKGRL